MEIDKQEVDAEFYGAFYQTERMIMTKCYDIFKFLCACSCFFQKKEVLYPIEECRKTGTIII